MFCSTLQSIQTRSEISKAQWSSWRWKIPLTNVRTLSDSRGHRRLLYGRRRLCHALRLSTRVESCNWIQPRWRWWAFRLTFQSFRLVRNQFALVECSLSSHVLVTLQFSEHETRFRLDWWVIGPCPSSNVITKIKRSEDWICPRNYVWWRGHYSVD